MVIQRVAIIYDGRPRPETTARYVQRAFSNYVNINHVLPEDLEHIRAGQYDLFVWIDDGLRYSVPAHLHPIVGWAIDTHLDDTWYSHFLSGFDITYAAQRDGAAALQTHGLSSTWLPLACDPEIHRRKAVAKIYDICFVGNLIPGPRSALVERLCQAFPKTFVGNRYYDRMAETYSQSRLVFNRSIRNDINMRVFEALACGSLLLTNNLSSNGQEELFESGVHLVTYEGEEDLLDKSLFYLGHETLREHVAAKGMNEAISRHTYRHRVEKILSDASKMARSLPVRPSRSALKDARQPAIEDYYDLLRPELLERVPASARDVLDVGCGGGRLGAAIKARQTAHVVGIEINPRAVTVAESRLDTVIEGDAESFEPRDHKFTFDVIICGDVLEHMRDPLIFLRKARSWLKRGGIVVASFPNVRNWAIVCSLLKGDWTYESAGILDQTHLRFFTRREIEKLLFRAGFEIQEISPVPDASHHDWTAAGRPKDISLGNFQGFCSSSEDVEEFFVYQWLVTARFSSAPPPKLTSIIILMHNELTYTRQCLDSIKLLTDEPYELILVDNGSSDGTVEYARSLAASDSRIRVIENDTNRGFPAAANQGIREAVGSQILLLNNDTIVTTGWLRRMTQAFAADQFIGLVGPCSNRVSGPQQISVTYTTLNSLDGFAWQWGNRNAKVYEATDRLVGFCLLIKREVIDRIGLLDDRYGLGNFEDDDYCLRALAAGFRAVIARDAFIHHFGSVTFQGADIDYAKLMQENKAHYESRWGEDISRGLNSDDKTRSESTTSRISLCMIVRNNEKTIEPCLRSIRPWVDEMIVVDTGSTDETPYLAARLGAKVYHFPWCDSFSAARNESIRHAKGEWIFWMDSDDTIDQENGRKLLRIANEASPDDKFGFVMQVHCPGPEATSHTDITVVDHVKLFRNNKGLTFEGRIHEQILPSIRRAGGDVHWTDVFVVHSGYDHTPDGQAKKIARDLKLLDLEYKEQPDHPFTLFNLGMTYADIGRADEAIVFLKKCLARSGDTDSHVRKAFSLIIHCYIQSGNTNEARDFSDQGLSRFPNDPELLFRRAMIMHQEGSLSEAAEYYQKLLSLPESRHFSSIDPSIRGFKARQNLAVVYSDMGDYDRSEAEWQRVTSELPHYRTGWRGLVEIQLCANRFAAARSIADHLEKCGTLPGEAEHIRARLAMSRNHLQDALRFANSATRNCPDDPEMLRLLGQVLFDLNEFREAEQAVRRLIAIVPLDSAAYSNLGKIAMNLRDYEAATVAFQRSIEIEASAERRLLLGHAMLGAGRNHEAIAVWEKILLEIPNYSGALTAIEHARHAPAIGTKRREGE